MPWAIRCEMAADAVDPDNPANTQAWTQLRADGWQPGDAVPESEPAHDAGAGSGVGAAAEGGVKAAPVRRDPRSRRQRTHDALKSGLRRYLDSGIADFRAVTPT